MKNSIMNIQKKYFICPRCYSVWTKNGFSGLSKLGQIEFLNGNGCILCKYEKWADGHYLGD